MKIELYTDGAATRNGLPGASAGFGWALIKDDVLINDGSGPIENGTNNQGELMGIIDGLKFIYENAENHFMPVIVISDSSYCIKGITEWIHNWKRNGWIASNKQEVKNKELWIELDELVTKLNLKWQWCKGHNNNKWNEYVDKLAYKAARQKEK